MSSPIIRRHRLGSELRQLRTQAKLTGSQVVERLGWASPSKLTRIERGQSRPDLADVMDLLDLYGATGADREKLIAIARDAANTRGWWRSLADLGARQRGTAELEAGAVLVREYQQFVLPGLLQTPDYARTRVTSGRDLHGDIDLGTDSLARHERQRVLTRPDDPVRYHAVIDEAALRRSAAEPSITHQQIAHLLEVSELTNVTLQVLPFDVRVGDFYVPHTSFSLYRFADPDDPETVVLETLTSDLHLRDDEDVALYRTVFALVTDAALDEQKTRALLRTVAGSGE